MNYVNSNKFAVFHLIFRIRFIVLDIHRILNNLIAYDLTLHLNKYYLDYKFCLR